MKFIQQMFSDVDGQGSNKRLISFGIFLLIAAITIGVTFFKATLNQNIWDDLNYTLWIGIGAVTAEKFTKRSIRNENGEKLGA